MYLRSLVLNPEWDHAALLTSAELRRRRRPAAEARPDLGHMTSASAAISLAPPTGGAA
jgi:hypothetical protein